MTPRPDLLHLSPEALTQATNAGLVKRALRELAAGYRPRLALDDAGLLQADFSDNVQCRWPAGVPIQQAACSCGAASVCRHRVIVALAYRDNDAALAGDGSAPAPAPAPAPAAIPARTGTAPPAAAGPASLPAAEPAPVTRADPTPTELAGDEALSRTIPASLLATARRLADAGMSVELRRRASGEPCDTARLPSATVRFWAGAAIEAARCDCLRAAACEHVALGVWAFRRAAAEAPGALPPPITSVRLGSAGARHAIDSAPFDALAAALLRHGVARGPGVLAQGIDMLAELALRLAAGVQPGRGEAALGTGVAGETALDRLRLISLGARTVRDGQRRRTTLVMADADTGTRLVLPHDWQVGADTSPADEAALRAAERLAPGVKLQALAQGQLLAQQAVRRADGSVRLARARGSQNSVLPQSADWAQLSAPVRFERVAALAAEQGAHPTAALLPRHAARRFIVFSGVTLDHVGYDPHEQSVLALLRDADGDELLLQRTHEGHTPHALDALAGALAGRFGPLRHVAGVLDWSHGQPRLVPWALGCDGIVVPDFADSASGALAALPLAALPPEPADPCAQRLAQLRRHLGTLLHHGLAGVPRSWPVDNEQLARQMDAAGLRALAGRLRLLGQLLWDARADGELSGAARALTELAALRQLHQDAATRAVAPADEAQDA
jgi:hypothetical protein